MLNSGKNADSVLNSFIKENLVKITNTFINTLAKCNSAAKPVCCL